jgi:hypothetical protein
MQTKTVVNSFQHEKKTQICNMAWNPSMTTQKEIAFCDCKGYLGLLENVTAQAEGKAKPSAKVANSLTDIGDDDAEISISQIKKDTGFTTNAEDGQDVFTGVQSYSMGIAHHLSYYYF